MENPSLLKEDWTKLWADIGELPEIDPVEPEPYNANPVQTTIDFCKKHEIYCPNPEIRPLI
ncbi:hypothetical protein TVAG_182450 [Trichomonas vaginalis G3]|uniref:Uncharacterized protein n=1 Tax=Trichomonas vaginalis (strain ATCC PRA-98 / G3) TaxID=412133 RepID=A2D8Y3_TRIV3|nr:hypothetical protein TVAGG3_0543920 [Trichomonas vaginalis G3]EAY23009.1 hypothetical protein TVAG_182450 [Trichomonas vaginalis G3]KAI5520038.1 hypothetical protein TVAGG3_0543920 [Trichomonas vaginalis G3]|eukprot:XP_001583995.1 hypothetical protein [Trichomonas vaginalis G3]